MAYISYGPRSGSLPDFPTRIEKRKLADWQNHFLPWVCRSQESICKISRISTITRLTPQATKVTNEQATLGGLSLGQFRTNSGAWTINRQDTSLATMQQPTPADVPQCIVKIFHIGEANSCPNPFMHGYSLSYSSKNSQMIKMVPSNNLHCGYCSISRYRCSCG
jgi:hypothetical protein